MTNPRQIVIDAAAGLGIGPEQQELGVVLCELRGQNPWEPIFAGMVHMERWRAAIAELRLFADVAARGPG